MSECTIPPDYSICLGKEGTIGEASRSLIGSKNRIRLFMSHVQTSSAVIDAAWPRKGEPHLS